MSASNYITSSSAISDNIVFKDNKPVFENQGAEVAELLLSVYQHFGFNYPKFYKMDNLSKLGWLAAEVLLQNGFKKDDYRPEEIGIVLTNANSSLDTDLKYVETIKEFPSPSVFVYTLPNIVIGEICIRNKFKGEQAFFIQEEFDPDFIVQHVNYLLGNDILKTCVCGWVDLLDQSYHASLFMIEKENHEGSVAFSTENLNAAFGNRI
ncbi:MAG TPA: hypothetical protein VHA56_13000 [Mucilaginibacter sp.]|nr:hypothetical protein [Mucilaginibacter sp.]